METLYESEAVVQLIPTIQCEINVGKPVILLRLRGCNCKCDWCDSKNTWSNNECKLTNNDILAIFKIKERFQNIDRLLITGGEPLLYQDQELFLDLLNLPFSFVEIETNGSLLNIEKSKFIHEIDRNHLTFNISPKLDINFYKNPKDYENFTNSKFKECLHYLSHEYQWSICTHLKFVYDPNSKFNLENIEDFLYTNECRSNIGLNSVYLMTNTPNHILNKLKNKNDKHLIYQELIKNDIETIKVCLDNGYSFSPRIHLMLFDDKNEMGTII